MDLIAFVMARLDEDEAAARQLGWGSQWVVTPDPSDPGEVRIGDARTPGQYLFRLSSPMADYLEHFARHDPVRVLREIEAKRAILARHSVIHGLRHVNWCAHCTDDRSGADWPCGDVLDIAAVWSDHPDYRAEWKP